VVRFCPVGSADGSALSCTVASSLAAWFDVDADGDTDMVSTTSRGPVLTLCDDNCSGAGNGLGLGGNQLTGTIPESLGFLTGLQ
jgi:hypothetical protein